MTNKEKYKKAFSVLHASGSISMEEENMNKKKNAYIMKKVLAACASAAVILGSMTAVYAADIGGIREKMMIWFHGEQIEAEITDRGNGSITAHFKDADGKPKEISGGGAAFDEFGNETALPAEDVLNVICDEVEVDEDGRIWLYTYDKKIDITDSFQEDGVCRVAVERDGRMCYFAIKDNGSGNYGFQMTIEKPEDAQRYKVAE